MPISKEKDGNIGKLFIHSSHVLSEAEQILLEYLDQPKSKNSSKCKYKMYRFNILTWQPYKDNARTGEWDSISKYPCE